MRELEVRIEKLKQALDIVTDELNRVKVTAIVNGLDNQLLVGRRIQAAIKEAERLRK